MKKKLAILLVLLMIVQASAMITVFADAPWSGAGTEEDPWIIADADDFVAVSTNASANGNYSGKYLEITENIDLDGYSWTPFVFRGHLDGNNKEISNFTLNTTAGNAGMFTFISNATVENVVIKSGSVASTSNTVGAFAGEIQAGGLLKNCVNYASVSGNQTIGGLVGIITNAAVEDCVNNGAVASAHTSISYAGGIAGWCFESATITDCTNNGSLTGSGYVGGIIGNDRMGLTITGCVNNGDLTVSHNNNGGIATVLSETSSIDNCINYGDIATASTTNGGIVAHTSGAVTNCKNYGDVTQTSWIAGGIAGVFSKGTLNNCENYGTITGGQNHTGGIVGQAGNNLEVTYCENYGTINGNYQYTGGIVGNMANGLINNCYNEGAVSGSNIVGGIVGNCASTSVSDCINEGDVSSTDKFAGGIAGDASGSEQAPSTIEDCYNEGIVGNSGTNQKSPGGAGGIAGNVKYATIANCINNGPITTTLKRAGGIAGVLDVSATVTDCSNDAAVEGPSELGGIAGAATSSSSFVTKSYNNGNVTGAGKQIGGIIGSASSALISFCGNQGTVSTAGGNVGGICGQLIGTGVITDCYNVSDSTGAAGFVGAVETVGASILNSYTYGTVNNAVANWKKGTLYCENLYYGGNVNNVLGTSTLLADEQFESGEAAWLLNTNHAEYSTEMVDEVETNVLITAPSYVWSQSDDINKPINADSVNNPVYKYTVNYIDGADVVYYKSAQTDTIKAFVAQYDVNMLAAVKSNECDFADDISFNSGLAKGEGNTSIFFWSGMKPLCKKTDR